MSETNVIFAPQEADGQVDLSELMELIKEQED
jgi:hypothetical protein